jgi:hypothetical protein
VTWLRVGDTAAHDPRTIAPLDHDDADERTVDEVFGFSVRLACEAGGKETDRVVTRAMVRSLAGTPARAARLMGILEAAGVWSQVEAGWILSNDPAYLHLPPQAKVERERIRGRDERNDALAVPARLRDGDNCRYCRKPVNWLDRKSLRGATWEHVNIANQPTQLDEYVVCCFECNRGPSKRGPLLPPPERPVYGEETQAFVKKRKGWKTWPTRATLTKEIALRTTAGNATERQRSDEESATRKGLRTSSENATHGQRPTVESASETPAQEPAQRPGNASENAPGATARPPQKEPPSRPPAPEPPDLAQGGVMEPDLPGRDGTGLVLPSRAEPGPAEPPRRPRRSRRRKPSLAKPSSPSQPQE